MQRNEWEGKIHFMKTQTMIKRTRPLFPIYAAASACLFFLLVSTGTTCNDGGSGVDDPNIIGAPGGNDNGGNDNTSGSQKPTVSSRDHIIGDANAPVTVIEYGDFQCPVCGRFDRDSWADIKANYVDTGKARFVFRHFPLRSIHDHAQDAAEAAECAGDQVDFFDFKSMVYDNQAAAFPESNAVPAGAPLSDSDLRAMLAGFVSNLGGSSSTFTNCASGTSKTSRVQADVDSGLALGVSATPTFFVNDEKVTGYRTAAQLGAIIDQHVDD